VRFLVDEDVAIEAARCLRQAGHEVLLVAEVLGVRTDDVDIWCHAAQTQAIEQSSLMILLADIATHVACHACCASGILGRANTL
jgi:predicted nuclease of predicted toxin-antitoxin system